MQFKIATYDTWIYFFKSFCVHLQLVHFVATSAFAWDLGSCSCPASEHEPRSQGEGGPWGRRNRASLGRNLYASIGIHNGSFNVSAMDQSSSSTGLEDRLLEVHLRWFDFDIQDRGIDIQRLDTQDRLGHATQDNQAKTA